MPPKTNATAQKKSSFDEKIAYYQHLAISNDLNELIHESSSSSDLKLSAVSSMSTCSSPDNKLANIPVEEYCVCQVSFP